MEQNNSASFSEMTGPNHKELNKISANIGTCNGTGTRLVSGEVIQKHNDYTLENLSKLHQTAEISRSFYKSLVKYYIYRLTLIHVCLKII